MKKTISTFLLVSTFAITPLMPISAVAASLPVEPAEAESSALGACPAGTFRVRRRTSTKRKVVGSLVTGGIGAAIGGGLGGKRGALIGAGSGAGGYLVYRYVRDRRGRCVRRYS
ncbi:MAG: hypothetical protein WKF34_09955 [Pyrinomonadaceae bacterium]